MSEHRQPEKDDSATSLWLFVGLAFFLLIALWVVLITMAVKNAPERIEASPPSHPVETAPAQSPATAPALDLHPDHL